MIAYIRLAKPKILFGNLVTTAGAFFLASQEGFNTKLFFFTLFGVACVIAAACAFNNYIDRYSDQKMSRTQNRPLPKKSISEKKALLFGSILLILGILILMLYCNVLTALLSASGFVIYVFVYSILKYYTPHATLVGSISGAIPAVAGYFAANPHFDTIAFMLFLIMVLWQMPHFFAIALYRLEDYKAANIPVLPLAKGLLRTKQNIIFYTVAFLAAIPPLCILCNKHWLTFLFATLLSASWVYLACKKMDSKWPRKMFIHSLIIIMTLFTSLALF